MLNIIRVRFETRDGKIRRLTKLEAKLVDEISALDYKIEILERASAIAYDKWIEINDNKDIAEDSVDLNEMLAKQIIQETKKQYSDELNFNMELAYDRKRREIC